MEATIGEQLRLAREGRGIPLREISDQTRISIHYLEAIESNDYKRLPGGIFNRSFVKAYARYVGYDEKEAIEGYTRYMRDSGDMGEEVATTPFHSKVYTDNSSATRSPLLTVALAIVILAVLSAVVLSVVYWVQRRSSIPAQFDTRGSVAFNESGRDTRGPSGLDIRKADYKQFLQ